MAVVTYATGINTVSGSLSKPVKKEGHTCGNYLIGTHREAPTTNQDCIRLYIRDVDAYKRSTPASANELAIRARFTAVSQAVAQRATDLNKVTADQASFIAQKDTPGGKKTMKAYLWSLEGATYDAAPPRS